jgi:hypothetical protein
MDCASAERPYPPEAGVILSLSKRSAVSKPHPSVLASIISQKMNDGARRTSG